MAVPVNFFHLDLALGCAGLEAGAAAAAAAAGSTVVGGESRAGVVVGGGLSEEGKGLIGD